MNTLAAGIGIHWNGIDGWLYFLAAVAFLLAFVGELGVRRLAGRALLLIAAGLLLWVLTALVTG